MLINVSTHGRKEGGREGKKEGRKEGEKRKEGRKIFFFRVLKIILVTNKYVEKGK